MCVLFLFIDHILKWLLSIWVQISEWDWNRNLHKQIIAKAGDPILQIIHPFRYTRSPGTDKPGLGPHSFS